MPGKFNKTLWTMGHNIENNGYKVFFVFVFTDKTMYIELKSDLMWEVKLTGSYGVAHALIPVNNLMDFDYLDSPDLETLSLDLAPELEV